MSRWKPTVVLLAAALVAATACSSSSDDGGDEEGGPVGTASGAVTIDASSSLERAMPELVSAYQAVEPGVVIRVSTAPGSEILEGITDGTREPDLYIDLDTRTSDVDAADVQPFGEDPMSLIVPQGNPGAVTGLEVFGPGQAATTVLCVEDAPCGAGAREQLAAAGVTPEPDEVLPGWREIATAVADGEFDASLLRRSEWINRIRRLEVVQVPPDVRLVDVYETAVISDDPEAQRFAEWVATSPEADEALRSRGLRALAGGGATDDSG